MDVLVAIPFTPELLGDVGDFDCGDEDYQQELAIWLQVEAPAFLEKGTRVWLFADADGNLVGFGSLGKTRWAYPDPMGKKRHLALIPAVAVRRSYWGLPHGPPEDRYASQILKFILAQAQEMADIEPVIGLFVHPKNQAAIRFYQRFGFADYPHQYVDPTTKIAYQAMVRPLCRSAQ
ncbi:MAG TPA: GNAT family N-acetyltransferase [Gemmataceae bacterium]|nr:GNAT family N-acetyltransferase [Gemmataceae bacterium]